MTNAPTACRSSISRQRRHVMGELRPADRVEGRGDPALDVGQGEADRLGAEIETDEALVALQQVVQKRYLDNGIHVPVPLRPSGFAPGSAPEPARRVDSIDPAVI